MGLKRVWDSEGQADWIEVKSWIERTSYVMYAKMKGEEDIPEAIEQSKDWDEFFRKMEWRKRLSKKWQQKNPDWEDSWQEPDNWLGGEKEWIEGQDSFWEKIRRKQKEERLKRQKSLESRSEEDRRKNKEMWARLNKEIEEEEEAKEGKRKRWAHSYIPQQGKGHRHR
jgi:hypothetical protein